jgi:hypothetical protein
MYQINAICDSNIESSLRLAFPRVNSTAHIVPFLYVCTMYTTETVFVLFVGNSCHIGKLPAFVELRSAIRLSSRINSLYKLSDSHIAWMRLLTLSPYGIFCY